MATFSYFGDKLSPETRVLIYSFVFGTSEHVKRTGSPNLPWDAFIVKDTRLRFYDLPTPKDTSAAAIDTSILAVSKDISAEALETLYNRKTVRLTFEQLLGDKGNDYLNFVRKLEIIDCVSVSKTYGGPAVIRSALQLASSLPRIRSVTILSDSLARLPGPNVHMTVRSFAESVDLGEVTCVDIGKYRLSGEYSKIMVANSKVLKLWPSVAGMPAEYDALAEARQVLVQWGLSTSLPKWMAWASQTSLRLWVGLFEQMLVEAAKPFDRHSVDIDSPEVGRRRDLGVWYQSIKFTTDVDRTPWGADGDRVPMHELGPRHDSSTLEWASELLAMNIETFVTPQEMFSTPGSCGDTQACWPELEDGESIGAARAAESRAEHQEWRKAYIVEHPLDPSRGYRVDSLKDMIVDDERPVRVALGVSEREVMEAGADDVRKMFYLLVAMGCCKLGSEDNDGTYEESQELDEWSRALLCTYLQKIGTLDDEDIAERSLKQLRDFYMHVGLALREVAPREPQSPADDSPDNQGDAEVDEREDVAEDSALYQPFLKVAAPAVRHLHATGKDLEMQPEFRIRNPIDERVDYSIADVKEYLRADKWCSTLFDLSDAELDHANAASNGAVKQIFYILVATGHHSLYHEGGTDNLEKRRELDEWSHALLCKYLRRGVAHFATARLEQEFELENLRALFSGLIHMLRLQQWRASTQHVPGAFPADNDDEVEMGVRHDGEFATVVAGDDELYQPFVKQLARAWVLLMSLEEGEEGGEEGAGGNCTAGSTGGEDDDERSEIDELDEAARTVMGWACVVS